MLLEKNVKWVLLIISLIVLAYSLKYSLLKECLLALILIILLQSSYERFGDRVKVATAHNSPPMVNSLMANLASTQNQLDEDSKYDNQ